MREHVNGGRERERERERDCYCCINLFVSITPKFLSSMSYHTDNIDNIIIILFKLNSCYHCTTSLDPDDLLPKDVESVASTVLRATREFQSKKFFEMRSKCINQDLTWKKPALKWEGMLEILQFGEDETSSGSNNGIEGKSGKEKKEEVTTPAQEL